ncbi:hypothetical protein RSOLAG1IB_02032 [Rhizoctonia solani AG-1 IB]|uniref:Uncharacterized protein n=1 Tax=Thanatephorus cucumeris (strain AG1-IB / isolate 7/3/14) TaxID=1108050 RepID=A0A0B7FIH1_THACB|nr:hypothetical protein RSOLAG1IB_02032 [Rhizoctonia solani AG-1 IB]
MAPPTTDIGSAENVKRPFALSHNRVQNGGGARCVSGNYGGRRDHASYSWGHQRNALPSHCGVQWEYVIDLSIRCLPF